MVRGPARANCVKICLEIADFRKGSNATESDLLGYVRFTPGSDRTADIRDRQLRANNSHPSNGLRVGPSGDFLLKLHLDGGLTSDDRIVVLSSVLSGRP
jgi:hypothetical protein